MYTKRMLQEEKLKRAIQKDFLLFCNYIDIDFFEERIFLKDIINTLDEITKSKKKRININYAVPRRSGKTYLTILYLCWLIGKNHKQKIMIVSYSLKKAERILEQVYQIIESKKYKAIFTLPPFEENTKSTKWFVDFHAPTLIASSITTGATGEGINYLIIDDVYKNWQESQSVAINDKIFNNYFTTLNSALEGDKQVEIQIGTRWRIGELSDVLEKQNHFDKQFKIKAIENNKSWCENIKTIKELEEERKRIGNDLFMAQYQQEPMLIANALYSLGELTFIDEIPKFCYSKFCVIDTKSTGKDNFSAVFNFVTDEGIVVADVLHTSEVLTDKLINKLKTMIDYYKIDYVFIETNQDYTLSLILEKETNAKIEQFKTFENKEVKIYTNAFEVKKRFVFLKSNDSEYKQFIKDVCSYSTVVKNKTDDAIDVLTMSNIKYKQNKNILGG